MSTVSSQFEQAVEQGKNAARRGEPLMTRAALKEYVTPDIIDPLTSAYMNAIRQSGGQRGGACKSNFSRMWIRVLILAAMGSGFAYSGGLSLIHGGSSTVAAVGTYVWGLLNGTATCTVTPGAPGLGSQVCIDLAKFGIAVRTGVSSGTIPLPEAIKAIMAAGGVYWKGGEALRAIVGVSGSTFDSLVETLCGIVFDDEGNFFITAFWVGLTSVTTHGRPGMAPADVAQIVQAAAAPVAVATAAAEGAAPPAEAAATSRRRGGYTRKYKKSRKIVKKYKNSRKHLRKTRRH